MAQSALLAQTMNAFCGMFCMSALCHHRLRLRTSSLCSQAAFSLIKSQQLTRLVEDVSQQSKDKDERSGTFCS